MIFFDGASRLNPGVAGAGSALFLNNNGEVPIATCKEFLGRATNNDAEFVSLYYGLLLAKKLGFRNINVVGDSKIVIGIINADMFPRSVTSTLFNDAIFDILETFNEVSISHVLRANNKVADALANEAITFEMSRVRTFNACYWLSKAGVLFPD